MKYVEKMKKWMCVILVIVMCGNLTGSVLAGVNDDGIVEWSSNGITYQAYVTKINSLTRDIVVRHWYYEGTGEGSTTTFFTKDEVVTKVMEGSFTSTYQSYLEDALNELGLKKSLSIQIVSNVYIAWNDSDPVGDYEVCVRLWGGYGMWGVLDMTSNEYTPMHVANGTYSFAPSHAEPELILKYLG